MELTAERAVSEIDNLIAEDNPSLNPALHSLINGQATNDDLKVFTAQMYHLISAIPRFISSTHSITHSHDDRRLLLEVLNTIEQDQPSPTELWLRTCASLALFSDSVAKHNQIHSTVACLGDIKYHCKESSVSGIAALYTYMCHVTQTTRLEQKALSEHFGLASGPGVEYFEVMSFKATQCAKYLREALINTIKTNSDNSIYAVDTVRNILVALNGFYSGLTPASTPTSFS